MADFGVWLRDLRLDTWDNWLNRPLSQARLAGMLDVSQSTVSRWESGRTQTLAPVDANHIAQVLDCDIGEILTVMGFDLGQEHLTKEEHRLVEAYRVLDPQDKQTVQRWVQSPSPLINEYALNN